LQQKCKKQGAAPSKGYREDNKSPESRVIAVILPQKTNIGFSGDPRTPESERQKQMQLLSPR